MNHFANIIGNWLETTVATQAYRRFVDFDVTQLDHSCVNPKTWLWAGLLSLSIAREIRDRHQWPFDVVLAFSLKSGRRIKGVNFGTILEFQQEYTRTPPSLYLFSPEQEAWQATPKTAITEDRFPIMLPDTQLFYSEYLDQPDPDYRRVFWIVSPMPIQLLVSTNV
jgi:hypothetical protein